MNRPIKFRGRVTANFEHGMHKGKLICGTLQDYSAANIKREDWHTGYWIYPGGKNGAYPVDPDSIAQLVGYDKDGNEVYEGDTVINPRDGTRFKAAMNHIYTVKLYIKEASDND